jgi:hypothetical protein
MINCVRRGLALAVFLCTLALASCGATLDSDLDTTRGASDRWRGQPGHHPNGHDPSFWNTKDKETSSYLANDKAPGQFPNGLDSNEKIDHGKKLNGKGATR